MRINKEKERVLTQAKLKSILSYNPKTGIFKWLVNMRYGYAGRRAGTIMTSGYVRIVIERKPYQAHRLAWLYMTGMWPSIDLDHKDTVKSNNKWKNLRLATASQNHANKKKWTGHLPKGVVRTKWNKTNQFIAHLRIGGKSIYLGYHPTPEKAAAAYRAAAIKYHGEFARWE